MMGQTKTHHNRDAFKSLIFSYKGFYKNQKLSNNGVFAFLE